MPTIKGRHFIKQWRKHRGLSLRKLADRLEISEGGEPLASHSRLNRIEKGEVGYTEEILHALAHALNVSVVELLEHDPRKPAEVIDLMSRLNADQKVEAQQFIEFLLAKTA